MDYLYLRKALQEINAIFDEPVKEKFNKKYEAFISVYDEKSILFCVDKYLSAEFDYITPGQRGIGRMNDSVPRLGGYFRKQLSNLSIDNKNELIHLIKQSIFIGYLSHVLTMEDELKKPTVSSEDTLFDKWIPGLYVSDISRVPNLSNFIYGASSETLLKVKSFMKQHDFKGGGFFSEDKTDLILSYYPIAGFGLRARE